MPSANRARRPGPRALNPAKLDQGVFDRRLFLDLVKDFIVFGDTGSDVSKILAGYHQFHAVRKAVESTLSATAAGGDRKAVGVSVLTKASARHATRRNGKKWVRDAKWPCFIGISCRTPCRAVSPRAAKIFSCAQSGQRTSHQAVPIAKSRHSAYKPCVVARTRRICMFSSMSQIAPARPWLMPDALRAV